MDLSLLYSTCVLGAVGLYLMMRPGKGAIKWAGGIVALAGGAWLLAKLPDALAMSPETRPQVFFWVFAVIAVAAAGRMITHPKPVYSALYFIMVVLSSAAIFLLLEAEFIAFALVIVYAGAILVTYLFVIMLAQQAQGGDDPTAGSEYDRSPREPAAAAVVGLLILAMLSQSTLGLADDPPMQKSATQARSEQWRELEQMPGKLQAFLDTEIEDEFTLGWADYPDMVSIAIDASVAAVRYTAEDGTQATAELPESMLPDNIQRVGLALVAKFPVSLEVAGIILLMAMFGAVVLARRQIELGEDELRQTAGMRRLPIDSGQEEDSGGAA